MPVQSILPARHGGKVELVKRFFLVAVLMASACSEDSSPSAPTAQPMTFFVTSQTSMTGNLGGLAGADATCQRLADAVGAGKWFWRAYLSVERDASNNNQPTNARDRIGTGPWYNATGALVANNVGELHARTRRRVVIRRRARTANQRPVDGIAVAGSARHPHRIERRRHVDARIHLRRLDVGFGGGCRAGRSFGGMGPGQSTAGALASWNSAHANQNCADTAPRGGAGRIYCFAR